MSWEPPTQQPHEGPAGDGLHLLILLPTEVLVEAQVAKIIAEAENGAFCLLPHHIDFVAALVPGILTFADASGNETFAAVDEAVLVKCGRDVLVSTPDGVCGATLEELEGLVEARFLQLDEQERKARTALARLEAGALRGFRELQAHGRG